MEFKTNYKDEIPLDGKRLYNIIEDKTGGIISKDVRLVRANGNTQDGDTFGATQANEIGMELNCLGEIANPSKINVAPDGFTLNSFGVIELDANYDILSLEHGGRYFCPSMGAQAPLTGMGAAIEVYPSTILDRVIVIHYRHNATSWQRAMYNGVWSDWKLIAGEITLWSGSVGVGIGVVVSQYKLKMFGHFKFITTDGITLEGSNAGTSVRVSVVDVYATNCYARGITALLNDVGDTINIIRPYSYTLLNAKTEIKTVKIIGLP